MSKYRSEIPWEPVRWNITTKHLVGIITYITLIKVMIRSSSLWCGILFVRFFVLTLYYESDEFLAAFFWKAWLYRFHPFGRFLGYDCKKCAFVFYLRFLYDHSRGLYYLFDLGVLAQTQRHGLHQQNFGIRPMTWNLLAPIYLPYFLSWWV